MQINKRKNVQFTRRASSKQQQQQKKKTKRIHCIDHQQTGVQCAFGSQRTAVVFVEFYFIYAVKCVYSGEQWKKKSTVWSHNVQHKTHKTKPIYRQLTTKCFTESAMNFSYLSFEMSSRTKQKKKCIKIIVAFSLNSYVGQQQHTKTLWQQYNWDTTTTSTSMKTWSNMTATITSTRGKTATIANLSANIKQHATTKRWKSAGGRCENREIHINWNRKWRFHWRWIRGSCEWANRNFYVAENCDFLCVCVSSFDLVLCEAFKAIACDASTFAIDSVPENSKMGWIALIMTNEWKMSLNKTAQKIVWIFILGDRF